MGTAHKGRMYITQESTILIIQSKILQRFGGLDLYLEQVSYFHVTTYFVASMIMKISSRNRDRTFLSQHAPMQR